MGTYTLPLKRAIELTGGTVAVESMTFNNVDLGAISKLTGGDIGVQHYPLFDENYRNILTGKIIDRFWNREIGFETIDLFKMKMRVKLNEIMPFYNQLYRSTQIEYEALSTINLKTTSTGKSTGIENATASTNSTNETTNASRAVNSQTPQTMLSGDEDYATSAADANSKANATANNQSTSEGTSSNETEGDTLVAGYQGTPADLIMRFRDSLINVDIMVLRDLEPLFMQTFDNADSYTERSLGYGYY